MCMCVCMYYHMPKGNAFKQAACGSSHTVVLTAKSVCVYVCVYEGMCVYVNMYIYIMLIYIYIYIYINSYHNNNL
jgi:hypothetical protein